MFNPVTEHPLIESLADLTEAELQVKITEIYKKLSIAQRMNNAWLCHQLQMALQNYNAAYQEKLRKDPDLPFSEVIDIQ